jgi:stress response protein YsnF
MRTDPVITYHHGLPGGAATIHCLEPGDDTTPVPGGNATAGPTLSEEEHEVTLHAERAVVDKETVPVERVRLDTETVTSQETVTEDVRKEQIEHDGANAVDLRGERAGADRVR